MCYWLSTREQSNILKRPAHSEPLILPPYANTPEIDSTTQFPVFPTLQKLPHQRPRPLPLPLNLIIIHLLLHIPCHLLLLLHLRIRRASLLRISFCRFLFGHFLPRVALGFPFSKIFYWKRSRKGRRKGEGLPGLGAMGGA